MVGKITHSSSLNSFSSICYCFITLGIHSYSSYKAVKRYKEADSKAWPGSGGTPSEVPLVLGSTIVSLLMLPFFCITSIIKVGNFANDGVKLGRDHALGSSLDSLQETPTKHKIVRRVWRHFCPLSQTVHLVAAFFLLLPETLLTAVEVKFGYRSSGKLSSRNEHFMSHFLSAIFPIARKKKAQCILLNSSLPSFCCLYRIQMNIHKEVESKLCGMSRKSGQFMQMHVVRRDLGIGNSQQLLVYSSVSQHFFVIIPNLNTSKILLSNPQ